MYLLIFMKKIILSLIHKNMMFLWLAKIRNLSIEIAKKKLAIFIANFLICFLDYYEFILSK